jgi:hypothetical protein
LRTGNNLVGLVEDTISGSTANCTFGVLAIPLNSACLAEEMSAFGDDWVSIWLAADDTCEGDIFFV